MALHNNGHQHNSKQVCNFKHLLSSTHAHCVGRFSQDMTLVDQVLPMAAFTTTFGKLEIHEGHSARLTTYVRYIRCIQCDRRSRTDSFWCNLCRSPHSILHIGYLHDPEILPSHFPSNATSRLGNQVSTISTVHGNSFWYHHSPCTWLERGLDK